MIPMRLAAIGFLARAAAHLLSFTPWSRFVGERTIWTLGTGVFVLALWMIRRQWGRVAVHDWRGLVTAVPPGLRFLVIGAALYAGMNFVLCLMVEDDVVACRCEEVSVGQIRRAARLGALAAFGDDIGLAFQVADDVLDATGTSAELGKTAGRDAELAKSTYVGLLGVDGARQEAERLAGRAVEHLRTAGIPSTALGALAEYIVTRSS